MLTSNIYLLKAFFLFVKVIQVSRDKAQEFSMRLTDTRPEIKRCLIGMLHHAGDEAERKLFELFDGEFKATPPSSHLLN